MKAHMPLENFTINISNQNAVNYGVWNMIQNLRDSQKEMTVFLLAVNI